MHSVTMPKLGETDSDTYTIEKWLVPEGVRVRAGQALLVVATDKTSIEVEARAAGHLRRRIYSEGAQVKAGATIALIGPPKAKIPRELLNPSQTPKSSPAKIPENASVHRANTEAPAPDSTVLHVRERTTGALPPAPVPLPREGDPPISPRARRKARELSLPLHALPLPAEGRRIVESDVLATAKQSASSGAIPATSARVVAERSLLSPTRRTIAESTTYSQQWIPQFNIDMLLHATPILALRQRLQTEWGPVEAPSIDDFFILALGRLLDYARFKPFRAIIDRTDVIYRGHINIGFAVSLGENEGVIVPVLRDVERFKLKELSSLTRDLTMKARLKRLRQAECIGGLMTLSNLGSSGVCSFRALVRPGEAAILALPAPMPRLLPPTSTISTPVPTWQVSLSVDHRLMDGALAANFLAKLKTVVESPESLL